jgi:predicted MPP superfamily phosphohydrolase
MSTQHIIWIDDMWAPQTKKTAHRRKVLEDVLLDAKTALKKSGCTVEWETERSAANGNMKLSQGPRRFSLAIVDGFFEGEEWTWRNLLSSLRDRSVPYAIFTQFLGDILADLDAVRDDPLFLGAYEKGVQNRFLVERIAGFFRAPPFRLLHISDLHCDALAQDAEKEEYEALIDSMISVVTPMRIDGVAITGDFAAKDPSRDLPFAVPFVARIIDASVTRPLIDRVFLIPGNHDVHWRSFKDKELAADPWWPFLSFYQAVYSERPSALRELRAWNTSTRSLRATATGSDIFWHRNVPEINLRVIGLSSTSIIQAEQGKGRLDKVTLGHISEQWGSKSPTGEIRLMLMHHNLFAVASRSRLDESDNVIGQGNVVYETLAGGCDLVLAGHTHAPSLISHSVAHFRKSRLDFGGSVSVLTAGTAGGFHAGKQRPRTFHVLDFGDANLRTGVRDLHVDTFCYDDLSRAWSCTGDTYRTEVGGRGRSFP